MSGADNEEANGSAGGGDAQPLDLAEALRPRKFRRAPLVDALPEPVRAELVRETVEFLSRRYKELAVRFDDISKTNFNPFLLLITAPVYNIYSPFEVAERLQLGKAFHGDDTAFGRMAEEKYLRLFGAETPIEKRQPSKKNLWSPIDLNIVIDGQRYLLSIKSGPWTMNQTHANEMVTNFHKLHKETGAKIIVGITYGRYKSLNNKPALVSTRLGNPDWYDFLVGKDFWEFVTGVRDVHRHIFSAIRDAQKQFSQLHSDETFHEKLVANRLKIASSLRKQFSVKDEEDFWWTLFNNMFESTAELPVSQASSGHSDDLPVEEAQGVAVDVPQAR